MLVVYSTYKETAGAWESGPTLFFPFVNNSLDVDSDKMGIRDDDNIDKHGARVPRKIRINRSEHFVFWMENKSNSTFFEYRYVEYSPGNTNLLFTVPHDGQSKPASIPTRQNVTFHISGWTLIWSLLSSLYPSSSVPGLQGGHRWCLQLPKQGRLPKTFPLQGKHQHTKHKWNWVRTWNKIGSDIFWLQHSRLRKTFKSSLH